MWKVRSAAILVGGASSCLPWLWPNCNPSLRPFNFPATIIRGLRASQTAFYLASSSALMASSCLIPSSISAETRASFPLDRSNWRDRANKLLPLWLC
ncbi:hypothetical protein BDV96DRAFT_589527 [Lophiotrema nucula]|uniref:Secreted protein n=1 Tax=Lophiotrema nucula TaxID=690887 RepID=A0A6A5YK09_9PLEO|nr:hypothetical protein BDV96DRAFT_589527 [Lophiotrema nucula]